MSDTALTPVLYPLIVLFRYMRSGGGFFAQTPLQCEDRDGYMRRWLYDNNNDKGNVTTYKRTANG